MKSPAGEPGFFMRCALKTPGIRALSAVLLWAADAVDKLPAPHELG